MTKPPHHSQTFRKDINGLRAWAVLAVLFYHFQIKGFAGGFVGVDVFFVISGFLMTGILVRGLEQASQEGSPAFSLTSFYLARARRLLPALLGVCVATLGIGWWLLSAREYKALGQETLGALSFCSNIQFWHDTGYFNPTNHDKLLLHTWSLSVEGQVYLLLPLVFHAMWKLRPGRRPLILMITLGFLLSLLLCLVVSPLKPSFSFYGLPTRAWEMLAGSLVFLVAPPLPLSFRKQITLEGLGLALFVVSTLLFDHTSNWPGWRAGVPVLGTCLILLAARKDSLWTGNRIAQALGDCSYSLYLGHWPFVVVLGYLELHDHPGVLALGLALTLLAGWLSYRLIENPARVSLARMPQRRTTGILLAASLMVALPSLWIWRHQGLPSRLSAHVNAVFNEEYNVNPDIPPTPHRMTESTPVQEQRYGGKTLGVLVVGDSHGMAVVRSVEKALPRKELHVLEWTLSNCPTIVGIQYIDFPHKRCGTWVSQVLTKQKSLPGSVPLILINREFTQYNRPQHYNPHFYIHTPYSPYNTTYWEEIRKGIIDTACAFAATRPVYMVRPVPLMPTGVARTMGRRLLFGKRPEVSISLEEYHESAAFTWETQDRAAERCGIKILDPLPYLCRNGRCTGDMDGLPLYRDNQHLNERGGSLLIPMFQKVFEDISSTP